MAGDIVYGDQIIRNVSQKINVPENVVRHVFNFIFPHIKQLTRKEGVLSIPLYHIGRLYLSTERLKYVLKNREKYNQVSKRQREHHRLMKRKLEKFEKIFSEISNGEYVFTVHKRGSSLRKYIYNGRKNYEELEKFQNHGK